MIKTINDISVHCFLYSGCAATSMGRACYTNQFRSLMSLDGKPEVAIAVNGTTSRNHKTFNITIFFSGCSYPFAIKIVEASNYDMILGVDFLSKQRRNQFSAVRFVGVCGSFLCLRVRHFSLLASAPCALCVFSLPVGLKLLNKLE